MRTVVIAYNLFPDIAVEQQVLDSANAKAVRINGLETADTQDILRNADALIVSLEHVTSEVIATMERCRIISRMGTGLDSIDIPAATAHGIWVTNVPDYSVDEVSTHAIALLLAAARRLPQLFELTRQGRWDSEAVRPIERLQEQILGVVGFGRIARAVAAKARGLGLEVIAYDPYVDSEIIEAEGVQSVEWRALLSNSDYISLHTPLTEETHNIVDASALSHMKSTAFLINTARGGLVDEDGLVAALRSKEIAGAALDVLSTEPPSPDHPLLHEDRVMITPHTAWYSEAATHDVRVRASEEVVRVLRGEEPRCPVNNVAG